MQPAALLPSAAYEPGLQKPVQAVALLPLLLKRPAGQSAQAVAALSSWSCFPAGHWPQAAEPAGANVLIPQVAQLVASVAADISPAGHGSHQPPSFHVPGGHGPMQQVAWGSAPAAVVSVKRASRWVPAAQAVVRLHAAQLTSQQTPLAAVASSPSTDVARADGPSTVPPGSVRFHVPRSVVPESQSVAWSAHVQPGRRKTAFLMVHPPLTLFCLEFWPHALPSMPHDSSSSRA